MEKTALTFRSARHRQNLTHHPETLTVDALRSHVAGWLLDGDYRHLSPATADLRRHITDKLLWYLETSGARECGSAEVVAFLAHVARGHREGEGRFANPRLIRAVTPSTSKTYFLHLRTLFRFIVKMGSLSSSPMDELEAPVVREDQIIPFTAEQILALERAARQSHWPKRNHAILLFLLDTGVRASEACDLRYHQLDFTNKKCTVTGKGSKVRTVYFGREAGRALWEYLREGHPMQKGVPLFISDRGGALTRSGMLQLIDRLGRKAGIEDAVRDSPHTFRHTFAIEFLRSGGNIFALQELLGHTDLKMVKRYLKLAQADLANQHRLHSPADRMKQAHRSQKSR